ncbi:MAG: hypothetical protein ABS888_06710, partial [Eubacteriales bacterium]
MMMIKRTGRQGINLSLGKIAIVFLVTLVMGIGLIPWMCVKAYAATYWNYTNSLPTAAGTYTLKEDVSISSTWEVNAAITLDLGGKTITMTGTGETVIKIKSGGNLTLKGNGTITGANVQNKDGGGVYVDGGTFTMQGGTICNNTAGSGGGVYVLGGTFTMQGGTISNNTTMWGGGGVDVFSGGTFTSTFTMEGGTICN